MILAAASGIGWLGLAAVGLFCLLVGVRELWFGRKSESWSCCAGKVIGSGVLRSHNGDGRANFTPRVIYVYSVEGREYRSSKIAYHGTGGTTHGASNLISSRYPEGSAVTVYYDPVKPSRAVLEVGFGVGNIITIGIGAIFFGSGIWAYVTTQ